MKNYKDSVEDRIDDILDTFDFVRVHNAMTVLNWHWLGRGIPTVNGLRSHAEDLLRDAVDKNLRYVGSGGLVATLHKTKDWFDLNLSFVVTDAGDDGVYFSEDTHKKHKIKIS